MRKTLLASVALILVSQAAGCSCCRALMDCERSKNQWLKDHCCGWLHHNQAVAVAPLTAIPAAVPIYTSPPPPVVVAPPQQPIYVTPSQPPMIAAPRAAAPAVCPPVAVAPPMQCQPVQCQPIQCQPVEQYCPQMCEDPCSMVCEPMWCP